MFVQRNQNNVIIAVSSVAQPGFSEQVTDNSDELLEFYASNSGKSELFRQSDAELVRVIEDLVDILTQKGVFQYTELPSEVRNKLNSRKVLRSERNNLDLLGTNEDDLPWP
ncbi:hypothetical protein [Marinobacter vinifirmus]|uniref:Tryptophan synthase subunit beta like protein n=1 Tax=Marinobacter vinifirmus TaxID=355591 RepID=A0A558B570_9GAMM|nr:hypothetical protein [Marinobacter vinifirmus]TVT31664.1 MAG: hypothetical protein FHK81_14305 [Marinobacter vinifirmus]|tara:strand:+ start:166 stop:498 length:333 start_codon:yes stop_codon:yes gene_type:complete